MDPLEQALSLRAGLVAWRAVDTGADRRALSKALRDNWDRRIGRAKFGGVWSIARARQNMRHPASREALGIDRTSWTKANVTVEHAVPIRVMFDHFIAADNDEKMETVIDAYHVAVITLAEDVRLRETGLHSKMPAGWQLGDDPLARWRQVGIEVEIPG
jgi:hypothetical protein